MVSYIFSFFFNLVEKNLLRVKNFSRCCKNGIACLRKGKLHDRQLFDAPPEIEVNYRDLETELPAHLPSFKNVFPRIIDLHKSSKAYIFGEDAMNYFIGYYDALYKKLYKIHI